MLRVVSIDPSGTGYELTARLSGLRWSNVANGGDESASFTFHAPWQAANPEVAAGNTLVVYDGLDVLFQGEIDEPERAGGESEALAITAYGLGARTKRTSLHEIYVDRDLGAWGEPSVQRRINVVAASFRYNADTSIGHQNAGATGPGIVFTFREFIAGYSEIGEVWYHGGGVDLGELRFDFATNGSPDVNWTDKGILSSDDLTTSRDDSTDLDQTAATGVSVSASTSGRKYALFQALYSGAATGDVADVLHAFVYPRVFGAHGLVKQGSAPNEGFFASQIIADIIGRVAGIRVRRLDATSYVIEQSEFKDAVSSAEALEATNEPHVHERTYGVWGPGSPLEDRGVGFFDYTVIDGATDHWTARRAQCEDIDLAADRSQLFNELVVNYTTPDGQAQTLTATRYVAELGATVQSKPVSIGTFTQGGAEAYAAAVLALYGGFAPARGSVQLAQPITHHRRGELAPHYMRADGSNLRLPDVLPSTTLFELTTDPDRRTTFPIERVEVDASDLAHPKVSVEVDQGSDALDALLARTAQDAELVGA